MLLGLLSGGGPELLQYTLPEAKDYVLPIAQPIFQEIITKFVPVAAAVMIGFAVLKRFSGGR